MGKSRLRAKRIIRVTIFLVVAAVLFYVLVPVPPMAFDQRWWMIGGKKIRGAMVQSLINQKLLIGKTENQVVEFLGKPDGKIPEQTCLTYAVDTTLRCTIVWRCDLLVFFDANTKQVTSVGHFD